LTEAEDQSPEGYRENNAQIRARTRREKALGPSELQYPANHVSNTLYRFEVESLTTGSGFRVIEFSALWFLLFDCMFSMSCWPVLPILPKAREVSRMVEKLLADKKNYTVLSHATRAKIRFTILRRSESCER
jgi:hypothetical protein